jgi:DUF1680 family protein
MELSFYNAVLSGISCNGTKFAYTNQLGSSNSDPSKRVDWFQCACCPPNITRLMGSIGGYLWQYEETSNQTVEITVHMYASGTILYQMHENSVIKLDLKTQYPWDGVMRFTLSSPEQASAKLRLRIPSWAPSFKVCELTPPRCSYH